MSPPEILTSFHLKRLMSLEPPVVCRNSERLKNWSDFWRVAVQLGPTHCHVQKNKYSLPRRKLVGPSILFTAAGSPRIRLNVMRLTEPRSNFCACPLVAHQTPNRKVQWHGERLHFRTIQGHALYRFTWWRPSFRRPFSLRLSEFHSAIHVIAWRPATAIASTYPIFSLDRSIHAPL
jgi:hypothetical protein